MKLFPSLQKRYTKERFTAVQAQRLAQEIAFGPIVFQVSRLMLKFGIFRLLSDNRKVCHWNRSARTPDCQSMPHKFYWKPHSP